MSDHVELKNLVDVLSDRKDRRVVFYDKKRNASVTFAELHAQITRAAQAIASMGVAPGHCVGVIAENGCDALLADLTLLKQSCTTVHMPEGAASDMLKLVGHGRLDFVLTSERYRHVLDRADFAEVGKLSGLSVFKRTAAGDVLYAGLKDVSAVIFSSGTSGRIKKILVNDVGVLYNAGVFFSALGAKPDDVFLIFLPLSNYQQKLLIYGCILFGINVCLTDAANVLSALKAIKPTLFLAPPVFYESAWRVAHIPPPTSDAAGDVATVAERLRAYFGGRTRMMLSGMAPIAPEILRGFRDANVPLYEAYGMTEYGPIAANLPARDRIGSVGRPLVEGSVSIGAGGEIIARSPYPLTRGYLDEPADEEAQVYRDAQRIATGDIGHFDEHGYLFIHGRKKETIVTSSGHKVHPQLVERAFYELPFVNHAVLMGNGMAHLGLLIMVENLVAGAEQSIVAKINELNDGVCASSPIRKWRLQTGKFTPEDGLLTRNLKLHRDNIFEKYQKLVFS
ncbi:MAG: AMP-binding protein [Sulfurifustaceae bacterium]